MILKSSTTKRDAAASSVASGESQNGRRAGLCLLGALAVLVAGNVLPGMPAHSAAASGPLTSVIVRGVPGAPLEADVKALGGQVSGQLGIIDGVAARVPAAAMSVLAHTPGVLQVTRNGSVHLLSSSYDPTTDVGSAYQTTQLTGAQAMWRAGYTGRGVDVALIDSGVTPVAGLDGAGKLLNGPDLSLDSQASNLQHLDAFGHGTFVAGIIGGRDSGAVSGSYVGDSTNFLGVAPDARILSVKVADSNGLTDVSQVLAAISWVVQHRRDNGMNVRVMNLSFGTDSNQPEILDPLSFAAEHAWKSGIVVVASVGNAGPQSGGVMDPAYNPFVIAAGASDPKGTQAVSNDTVASFSSYGNGIRNPDLVAPGKSMQSLRVPGSYIDLAYSATGEIDSRFFRGSGTSESAAVLSGAAALLLQQRPSASPDQVKAILTGTATALTGQPAAGQGHGELNLVAASRAGTPLLAGQLYLPATGLGSIEAARGTGHLTMGGVTLNTNVDIFGSAVSSNLVTAILNDVAWSGGNFNGNTWSGNTWSGNTWSGNTWSGNTWSGNTWSGNTWSGNTWSGNTWSGNTWSGNTWSGNTWSGNTWSGNTWSGNTWS